MDKKRVKQVAVVSAVVLLGVLVLVLCLRKKGSDVQSSQAEVQEAYDLEQTVRILNGIWIAQDQLDSFDSFQSYMEQQDYSEVPEDVKVAKDSALLFLKQINQLDQKHKEQIWRSVMPKLGSNLVKRMSTEDYALLLTSPKLGAINVVKEAAISAFDTYELNLQEKDELRQQIDEAKTLYYHFLNAFIPVYYKYMQEWDQLCLERDKAYIALYNKQPDQVIEYCDNVLSKYPDNRETLLLKAMGLIQLSRWNQGEEPIQFSKNNEAPMQSNDALLDEALEIIEQYESNRKFSKQTAPALLLEGLVMEYQGNHAQALTLFHQSAEEYPRQAEQLSDMLNSYENRRTYLNKSVEGTNLLNLYKSIMLGSGYFSPNFMKALYFEHQGDLESCSQEIYNHFYRRGKQDAYDGMLTDMRFCEEFFPTSFSRLVPERNYVNVSFEKHKKNDKSIDVTVDNQSDIVLTNLRIFLCIHFSGMVDGDYHIVKVPEIGRLEVQNQVTQEDVKLGRSGKTVDNIAEVRAIAMIEINGVSRICWFENVCNTTKKEPVDYNKAHNMSMQELMAKPDYSAIQKRNAYLEAISMSDEGFQNLIKEKMKVTYVTGRLGGLTVKDKVIIELPCEQINQLIPTFKWNNRLMPEECYVKNGNLHMKFMTSLDKKSENVLYMTSQYLNYAIYIKYDSPSIWQKEIDLQVESVKNLAE